MPGIETLDAPPHPALSQRERADKVVAAGDLILDPIAPLLDCCIASARKDLRQAGDIGVCDRCGLLLLSYADEASFERARDGLAGPGVHGGLDGKLRLIAKPRRR